MSNQLSELIYENKENYLNFENNSEDKTPSFLNISNEISTSSIESKSDEIYKHYFFLCKFCETIPLLDISKNGKISYKCKCENEYKDLSIEEIYKNLFYSEDFESENEKIKCFFFMGINILIIVRNATIIFVLNALKIAKNIEMNWLCLESMIIILLKK